MSDSGDKQLGVLASITAAIEARQTEIESVQIQTRAETYKAQVQLAIPLNRVNRLHRARIETNHTEFVDDSLQFDVTIYIDDADHGDSGATQADSQGQSETGDRSGSDGEPADTSGDRSASDSKSDDADTDDTDTDTETEDADTDDTDTEDVAETPDEDTGSEQPDDGPDDRELSDTDGREETPPYQDPETLENVYDENATFEDMRDELGVDVTAQTVRKYMIKHEIHEPEPRPDRLLETIRASELELMNSESGENGSFGHSDTSPDSDATSK